MRFGLTYDLRSDYLALGCGLEETAELDAADTIEGLEAAIAANGHETERIGRLDELTAALAAGRRWDMVFNIAEGLYGLGRESAVPAVLDAHRIPYVFSDPMTLALTLHKGMTKRVVRDLGLATPDFAVVSDMVDAAAVDLPFPLFAKPVAEGTGKGVESASKIRDRAGLLAVCQALLAKYVQPVLVETYLPGREFTVGVVGNGREARVVGVMEILLKDGAAPEGYTYANKADYERVCEYRLADDADAGQAALLALAAYRGLGVRDAGRADIRLDARGRAGFMEINALAGLNPTHSDLPIMCALSGVSYNELIGMILDAAVRRAFKGDIHARRGPA